MSLIDDLLENLKFEQELVKHPPPTGTKPPTQVAFDLDMLEPTMSLEQVSVGQCRWPYDDLMCCGRAVTHKVYCQDHTARAFKRSQQ